MKPPTAADVDLGALPQLPQTWRWCVPAEICTVVASGSTPKPHQMFKEGDIPFIKVYNLTDRGVLDFTVKPTFIDKQTHTGPLARSRTFPGDVLINIVGPPLGKVSLVPDDHPEWNINQAVVTFRPSDQICNRYLVYALLTEEVMKRVTSLAKATAGQSNIGVGMCRHSLPIPVAPRPEQDRIVAKIEELFSDLDAGVAALERARANLKRYRASLLKSAVDGSLTADWRARHPDTEPASKLLERILKQRREKWEANQLAKFTAAGKSPPKGWQSKYVEPSRLPDAGASDHPRGWLTASLSQLALFQNGHAFPSKEYCAKGIKLLRPGNLFADGSVKWNDRNTRCLPDEWGDQHSAYIVRGDELVMNLTAQSLKDDFLGRVCLTSKQELCLLNQRIARISAVPCVSPQYLLIVLKSQVFRKFVTSLNSGSLIQHMFTSQLDEFIFALPPIDEQHEIVAEVSARLSQIEAAETEINHALHRAPRLCQAILKQAFIGKLVPQDPSDEPVAALLDSKPSREEVAAKIGRGRKARVPVRVEAEN